MAIAAGGAYSDVKNNSPTALCCFQMCAENLDGTWNNRNLAYNIAKMQLCLLGRVDPDIVME
jgi:hypothetical protein